jgi:hypothetical protein
MATAAIEQQYLHPKATIFLFDWDDTLLPTSAVGLQGGLEKTLPALLSQVDDMVVSLLRSCLKLPCSQVTILTNADEKWVWSSASFLPQTLALLRSGVVSVVSANKRDTNQSFELWKDDMVRALAGPYEKVLERLRPRTLHVVAVGDCNHDLEAGRTLAQLLRHQVQRSSVKAVRMRSQPSIVEILAEHRAVLSALPGLCATRGDMSCTLQLRSARSPLDMFKVSMAPLEESCLPSKRQPEAEQSTAPAFKRACAGGA